MDDSGRRMPAAAIRASKAVYILTNRRWAFGLVRLVRLELEVRRISREARPVPVVRVANKAAHLAASEQRTPTARVTDGLKGGEALLGSGADLRGGLGAFLVPVPVPGGQGETAGAVDIGGFWAFG